MSTEQNASSYDQTPECRHIRTHKPHSHINTHTHSLSAHRRGSDQEEITPHNKSNTKVSAEEVEIRVSSIHSSGSDKHWHTAYHQEHLSHMEHGHGHTSNKYGHMLIKNAHKKYTHWNMHTHKQDRWVFKRTGSECTLLSVVLMSGSIGPLDSRAHILYLICSRPALHNVNIILHCSGTQDPSYPWSCSVL